MPSTILTTSHSELAAPVMHEAMEEQQATENLSSLSAVEERERKQFMNDINKFMIEIGKPLSKIPIMGYKELDLFQLFKEVCAYGGFNEVVKNVGTWSKIWKRLGNFDPSITDSSFRLKKNYERYLLEYEYKCFPDHRQQAIEIEKQMQLKKSQQSMPIFSAAQPLETLAPASPTSSYTASPLGTPKQARKQDKGAFGNNNKKQPTSPVSAPVSPAGSKRRPFAVSKDAMPKFPLALGELCIESIGTIIARPPYITEKHVWPVGFSSTRFFSSMINPEIRVKYTSQIVDADGKPQFIVTAADDLLNPIVSHSPSGAWRTVLKRVMNKSGTSDDRSKNVSVSGTLRFGLAHPVVASLLRELPGAEKSRDFMLTATNNASANDALSTSANKKRKNGDNSNSEDSSSSDEFAAEWLSGSKSPRYTEQPSSPSLSDGDEGMYKDVSTEVPDIPMSQEEAEDLESAVSVLQALKYCTVY